MTQKEPGRRPAVSIVAYVYNYEGWVAAMIESVLGQTYREFEFFFLDDGSTDGTGDVVRRYAHDPRLRYERQDRRGRDRLHETFNRCLESTRGELIAVANGDDVLEPEKIARQVEVLESRPEIDVCFHDAQFLDEEGHPRPGSFRPPIDPHVLESGRLGPHMFGYNLIPNPTAMFRRSSLRRIGLQEYGWPHDYQFWLKAAVTGCRFHFLPDRLIRYRVHERSHSTSSKRESRLREESHRMRREMRARYSIEHLYPEIALCRDAERARALAHLDLGLKCAVGPEPFPELAEEEFRSALRWSPGLAQAANNLGVVLLVQGRTGEAVEILEKVAGGGGDPLASRNLARIRAAENEGYELALFPATEELFELRAGPALGPAEDPPEATILATVDESDDPIAIRELLQEYFGACSFRDPVSLVFLTSDDASTRNLAELHGTTSQACGVDPLGTPLVYVQQVTPGDLDAVLGGHLHSARFVVPLGGNRARHLERLARSAHRSVLGRGDLRSLRTLTESNASTDTQSPAVARPI
jgi:glycosyltransferase involved in cell wall biosynthesis